MVANIRLPADNAAARRVTILAGAFARLGADVKLFMPCPREALGSEDSVPGVEFRWGAYPTPERQWRTRNGRVNVLTQLFARASWVGQLLVATMRARYDWIYVYHPSPEGAFLACVARLSGRGVVVEQVDGFYYTWSTFSLLEFVHLQIHRFSVWTAKRVASFIVVISSRLAGASPRGAAVLRVPALVDCARFQAGNPDRVRTRLNGRKARWIVYAGSLNTDAGFTELLAAVAKVVRLVPDAYLIFAGDRMALTATPEAVISRYGLEQYAEYAGLLKYSEVVDLMALADVLVMPKASSALNDMGFPTKVAEYMASGRPVVATRISDIPEYLTDGVDAFLCNPGDVDALADGIVVALEASPEMRARVGRAGRLVAYRSFDVHANAARIIGAMLHEDGRRLGRTG